MLNINLLSLSPQLFSLNNNLFTLNIVLFILNYCCPLNFKAPQFPYPQCPSIGVADFFLEK